MQTFLGTLSSIVAATTASQSMPQDTQHRSSLQSICRHLTVHQHVQVSNLEAQVSQQQQLIKQLEDDLAAAGSMSGGVAVAAPGTPPAGGSGSSFSAVLGGAVSRSTEEAGGGGGDTVDISMLRVLVGQRDRLRQRVQELEEQLATTKQELQVGLSTAY